MASCPNSAGAPGMGLESENVPSGARYVAILGEEGTVLKDMDSGEQEELAPTAVVASVLKGRHLS